MTRTSDPRAIRRSVLAHPAMTGAALPRQYLPACLLLLIGRRPAHGYDLREGLAQMGVQSRDTGQLYRVLRSLEGEGLLVSTWHASGGGPARRTYSLTAAGEARLHQWAHGMTAGQHVVSAFLACHRESADSGPTEASA